MQIDRQHDDPDALRCRICGFDAPLSFEHVPPRAAFNGDRAEMLGLDAWLARDQETDEPERSPRSWRAPSLR
jgi:hypothetical protein